VSPAGKTNDGDDDDDDSNYSIWKYCNSEMIKSMIAVMIIIASM
jgi:hypothetical protein